MSDELDPRIEHMARAIYEAYGALIGEEAAYRWDATDGTISDSTKAKYRAIADDALDKIEWTRLLLVRVPDKDARYDKPEDDPLFKAHHPSGLGYCVWEDK